MNEALMAPVRIHLPDGAPKIIRREQVPDARQIVVVPLRVSKDRRLTAQTLRVFLACCSYANRAGLFWAGQKRIGQDLGISQQATSVHMKRLEKWGYIKTLYAGWAGERASTRQIIYNPEATLKDIMEKTQASAPFIEQKQAKRRGRPPKGSKIETKQTDNGQPVVESMSEMHGSKLVDELKAKVSSKVWNLAVSRVGNDTDYLALKQVVHKLLR